MALLNKDRLASFLKSLLHVHYLTNILLASSYYVLKSIPYVCDTVFESCVLEWREWEILVLLLIFISVKSRKAATALQYVNTICTFSKGASVILYWREGPLYTFAFVLCWFLHFVFLPQPVYKGPENIQYFRGSHLDNEIKSDDRLTWLVCFYAPWSPPCIDLAPVFAELSNKYGDLKNFRFAKIDVSRYQDMAKSHLIDISSLSKQLPTIILFQKCVEVKRRPFMDSKHVVYPFIFSRDNIVKEFDLNTIYYECKKTPIVIKPLTANTNDGEQVDNKKSN